MQTKYQSVIETITGLLIGMIVSFFIQRSIFPLYGIHIEPQQDVQIVLIFTAASFIRGYIVRRAFNRLHRSTK